ncbi:carbon storage regulator [Microbulbifer sp. DLAB2-AA]|uniref:carbon storage regulator n=1 Tax=Microbulbifer sp. DLAB2-AA TaxID=3243394 RepID=UPI0040397BF3
MKRPNQFPSASPPPFTDPRPPLQTDENLKVGTIVHTAVLEVKGNQVKIGIRAPKSLPAYREKIYTRIKVKQKVGTERQWEQIHDGEAPPTPPPHYPHSGISEGTLSQR